jgi:adenine-specific DNA-methyltransferase
MPTLHWIGKDKVINHHREVPFKILEHKYHFENAIESTAPSLSPSPCGEGLGVRSVSGNKIIHGDNLEALKALLPEYEGRIKCIYIDPPYNTGNESWVYNDNVNDPKIKKWLGQVVGKESEDLSRHDKWLCMMYPRLKMLHKLLANDGAIFISIDDNEQANLRLMCDEIFGNNNFINNIVWQKKYSPQNDAKYFSDMHDFIICYSKEKSKWSRNLTKRTDEQNSRYKNLDNDPRGVWKSSDLSVKTYSKAYDYPVKTPSGKIINPPQGRCWRTSKENLDILIAENRIYFGKNGDNVPSIKRFLSDVQDGTVPVTLWLRDEVGDNQEARQILKKLFFDKEFPFDTPKPPRLIEKILQISTNKNDIVLDSYAGSATTAHAVLNLNKHDGGNRKFIMIEMEEYAETITAERVKRVMNGYGSAGSPIAEGTGGSFDFYELGKPLFVGENNEYLNEEVELEKIHQYIWYSETRTPFVKHKTKDTNSYYLGKKEGLALYFIYEKEYMTELNYDMLATIKTKAEQFIIYADSCLLPKEFMMKNNIVFKKIPRDITRF